MNLPQSWQIDLNVPESTMVKVTMMLEGQAVAIGIRCLMAQGWFGETWVQVFQTTWKIFLRAWVGEQY
jgi:hypothetical protein